VDTRDFEVIWAPIPTDWDEWARSFEFRFNGHSYRCEFGNMSNRVRLIAQAIHGALPESRTNYRNLLRLRHFVRHVKENPDSPAAKTWAPTSFWIRNIDWEEDSVVDLTRHLNFYVRYFDRKAPHILIHEESLGDASQQAPIRYPFGDFPPLISGRQLHDHLLRLWESTLDPIDPFRLFLYNYHILEYAAFYHLDKEIHQSVKRIVSAPETLSRPDDAVRHILDAMVEARKSDEAKIVEVVRQFVEPKKLWQEMQQNAAFFSSDVRFDGGFNLPAILKEDSTLELFEGVWIPKFPDTLRKLRNALVHSREARMATSVTPTKANYDRLRPWTRLASIAATDIILNWA
jgi:hypothetical protein